MLLEIVLCCFLLFLLFFRRIIFWGSDVHKIPGPWPLPVIGSALELRTSAEKVIPLVDNFQKEYGSTFLLWIGPIPIINIASPDAAEAILSSKRNIKKGRAYRLLEPWLGLGLLTSDGNRWFSHRRLITPTFHFSILESFLDIFQENTQILLEDLQFAAESGESIELQSYIKRCTLDIICEAAMGTKISAQKQAKMSESDTDEATSSYIRSIFRISQLTTMRILNILVRPSIIFFNTKLGRSYNKHLAVVHNFTKNVIASRKLSSRAEEHFVAQSETKERRAFLDLLLEARDQDGLPLSDQDIREEVDTFMFEGHDTTATGLVWTLYLLGHHPEIQETVYEELLTVLGGDISKKVTLSDLADLKTLERVIKETLRLFPSVPTVTRHIDKEFQLDGYNVPEGSAVLLHIYHMHRDPKIYPDPEKFDPDRFLPENIAKRHPYAYIPFSAGPRNCIGQKFALLEEKIVLAGILREYEVNFLGVLDRSKIRSELILRPPEGMNFKLVKRKP